MTKQDERIMHHHINNVLFNSSFKYNNDKVKICLIPENSIGYDDEEITNIKAKYQEKGFTFCR